MELYSSRQVADALGREKSVVNRWAAKHGVRKVGGTFIWDRDKVAEYKKVVEWTEAHGTYYRG